MTHTHILQKLPVNKDMYTLTVKTHRFRRLKQNFCALKIYSWSEKRRCPHFEGVLREGFHCMCIQYLSV